MIELPQRAGVVIVGGGFAGAATAYALGRAGIDDVLILERESTCGYHASGRNAALCRQITENQGFTELAVAGAEFLREPPAEFSEVPLVHVTGSVLTCDDAGHIDELLERAAAHDVPAEAIAVDALIDRWPRLRGVPASGGVFFPSDGVIDVHALLQGFLAGARRHGTRVVVDCEVTGIRDRGDEAEVVTPHGAVRTGCVVIAAGAWAGELGVSAGSRDTVYHPIRRHLYVTEPIADLDREAPFVWHIGADEFYVRPEGSGYLLSACDETEMAPCDARPDPGNVDYLAEKLAAVAPGLVSLGVARAWACLRTFSPSGSPVIGWDEQVSWLFWVAGLGGHGATASAAVGEAASVKIAARLPR
jgi:D-arginine dehydrogenase